MDGPKAEAQADLDEARAEYEKEEARAKTELADARAELDAAKEELDEGQRKLDAAASTLAANEKKIKDGEKEYTQGTDALSKRKADAEAQFAEAEQQIAANEANLAEANAALPTLQDALAQAEAALQVPNLPADQRAELEATRADLEQKIADIGNAATALEEAKTQLAKERASADAQIAAAQAQLDQAKTSVEEGKKQLEEGKAEYEKAKADLEAGRAEYEQGVADYDAAAAEANEELDKAEQELADAQKEIDDIEPPDWLVMDRTKNFGVVSFASDADRIDAIASFFPFIFFLVAALVALTTMTRMVEEERMLIGTFKALGYSRARITSKYLIYAALAAGAGSVIGIAVLSQVLPWVIMEAYSIVYYVPRAAMPIDWPIALAAAGLGIGITLLATWAAAAATLRETPAALMQPPAPKAGKRILLERVGPLWRRLSFSWKVTFRNIFRYKRRLVMTCVGIAGCTALLLTGLGLQNSINDIIDVQYGELVDYNVVISEKDDAADDEREAAAALLGDAEKLPVAVRATEVSMIAQGVDGTEAMTTIVAPSDPEAFKELWRFRTREGHDDVGLTDAGAIVTEKLATKLGLSVGDAIVFVEQDDLGNATATTYSVPVTGIIENYIGDYAFMTPETYARTFGEEPDNLTVYARATTDEGERSALSEALRATGAVDTVAFNDEVIDSYKQMLRSVNMVVVVLVVAAAALAFIVLYNLTNINITERAREIATLKVLGFTPREVNAYIFREIVLLAMLGALVGLGDAEKLPVAVRATEVSMIAQGADGTEAMTTIVAPSDPEAFKELWHFRTREGHDEVGLTDAGAIATEKLATKLGLSVGDAIVFAEQDDLGNATATTYSVPVTGIIENYIGDYAFMTPETYARTFGEEPDNLTVYARATTDEGERSALSEALRATGAVDTVAFNDEVIDSYKQMLRSVNMVVVVLVVAAAALAFIVLYNLTNINITERAREIATLKVLGFTPREVNAYIFREIVLLAMLGALVGLGLGVVLEGFVVVTAEVDQVMFGRTIHWDSFVIAFVLTMVFTAVVMVVMRPKLAHIDMVESLKSNE